jgi:hypothetical protein
VTAADPPAEAVRAAVESGWHDSFTVPSYMDIHTALAAAAPHMHADCGCAAACVAKPGIRAQVLAEVDAALRDDERIKDWLRRGDMDRRAIGFPAAADYLRDTLAGDGWGGVMTNPVADLHRRRARQWIAFGLVWAAFNAWLLWHYRADPEHALTLQIVRFLSGSAWWPWAYAAWHYGWLARDRKAPEAE